MSDQMQILPTLPQVLTKMNPFYQAPEQVVETEREGDNEVEDQDVEWGLFHNNFRQMMKTGGSK